MTQQERVENKLSVRKAENLSAALPSPEASAGSRPVLLCCYEYPPLGGGGARVVANLAADLTALGVPVELITMHYRDLPRDSWKGGLRIFRVPGVRTRIEICQPWEMVPYVFSAFNKLWWRLRSRKYLVNHTHFILPDGLVAWVAKRLLGLPFILTAHGSDVPGYNPDRFTLMHRLLQPLWQKITSAAEIIICPSRHIEQLVLQANPAARTHVTPNGIDPDRFRGDREKVERIVVVTRMFERKGVQFLLQALARLDAYPEVCLVGDGPYLPELRLMAAKLGSRVRFTGFLDNKSPEFVDLLETSRYFVFTSIAENFPIVLLEAMCAGMTIITSNDSGCQEVVGDAAVKVPPANIELLRDALAALLSDPERAADLGRRARQRVEENFSSMAVTRDHIMLYERVANRYVTAGTRLPE